jgi:non-homologous end joining protein Ku
VEVLAAAWEPKRYADEYRRDLLRIISEKPLVQTEAATDTGPTPAPTSRAEELMEALRRSVEQAKSEQERTEAPKRRKTG